MKPVHITCALVDGVGRVPAALDRLAVPVRTVRVDGVPCFALHAKYGLPPHRMTSKAINDVKKFSGADRAKWLEIKRNDSNASTKCKGAVVGFTAMKKKRKRGGD